MTAHTGSLPRTLKNGHHDDDDRAAVLVALVAGEHCTLSSEWLERSADLLLSTSIIVQCPFWAALLTPYF